jgi:hypothetical protein
MQYRLHNSYVITNVIDGRVDRKSLIDLPYFGQLVLHTHSGDDAYWPINRAAIHIPDLNNRDKWNVFYDVLRVPDSDFDVDAAHEDLRLIAATKLRASDSDWLRVIKWRLGLYYRAI